MGGTPLGQAIGNIYGTRAWSPSTFANFLSSGASVAPTPGNRGLVFTAPNALINQSGSNVSAPGGSTNFNEATGQYAPGTGPLWQTNATSIPQRRQTRSLYDPANAGFLLHDRVRNPMWRPVDTNNVDAINGTVNPEFRNTRTEPGTAQQYQYTQPGYTGYTSPWARQSQSWYSPYTSGTYSGSRYGVGGK